MSTQKPGMSIEKWLSDVKYDQWGGKYLWNEQANGDMQMIGEVRGWGVLHHYFETQEEGKKFQDEVGEFIASAIREKVQRLKEEQHRHVSLDEVLRIAHEDRTQRKK
jgi:hypothetical protein